MKRWRHVFWSVGHGKGIHGGNANGNACGVESGVNACLLKECGFVS